MSDVETSPVGSLWQIPSKSTVEITRPDGTGVTVAADGKVAVHVLDVAGTYTASNRYGMTRTVEAV